MDIDNELIKGLDISSKEISHPPKIENIDIEISAEVNGDSDKTIASTPDEAIAAMNENSIIRDGVNASHISDEKATIVVETEKSDSMDVDSSDETDEENEEVRVSVDVLESIGENVSRLISEVDSIKASISRFDGYDKAVETLKRSLAANQRNEDSIYKELETYKKNQYFNYIRPFLDFLINLLTDMINSKKQYENDKEEFVQQHGQEVFDEIIDLHDYYVQQIENQLQIQGVEIIHYESESAFVPTEQLISKTILTDDHTLSGIVGKVDSACYKFEDKILKKAKVQVYKSKPVENK